MKLIIINWLPATGKTTLWKKISEKLNLAFFSKDAIKEIIFDYIWDKKEIWKQKISKASYWIFYYIFEQNLKVWNSMILESNFIPEFSNKIFLDFLKKYDFDIIQIFCETEGNILFERFKKRSLWEDRHSWHDDKNNIEIWKDTFINWDLEPLNIPWKLIKLNTTDFEKIDYEGLYEEIGK